MADIVVPTSFIKNWDKNGRDEVYRLCKNCSKDKDGRLSDSSFLCGITDLKRVIYELLWHVIRGDLKQEDALVVLEETKELHPTSLSMLADLICIMDVENQCLEDKVCRDRFLSLVAASVSVIPEVLLKERLDIETLDALGFIQSQKTFNQKYVKTKTKLFYKQQKYNLLREESEGYAKLIVELAQEVGGHVSDSSVLQNIKSIIGQFHVDPNRTLDIILECFECNLNKEAFFLPLLKSYMGRSGTASLFQILGFKFQFYKDQPGDSTPSTLYHLAALLIKHGLIGLEDLYLHLSPTDNEIGVACKQMMSEMKQDARKLNSTILAEMTNNSEEGKENNSVKDNEKLKPDVPPDNQKFGLCEALIMVGAWSSAMLIMEKLPTYATVTHPPIAEALCKLLHSTIEPLYRKHASKAARGRPYTTISGGPCQVYSYSDLLQDVFPMFNQLGPYLSCDPILMAKILRVGKGFLREYPHAFEAKSNSPTSPEIQNVWCGFLTLVDEVLLPSISLLECNSSLAEELWGMLKCYPYQVRYRLYGQWKNESYDKYMALVKVKAETIKKARYITKRLTKENVKPSGRQIGKISHSNPGVVFEYLLTQIQKYDNFIGPVVDSLKYLTQLAYDMLAFCIIEALANPEKERLKLEDTNISDWLKSLAVFCGTVFRKYPIELTCLLQYVTNQLKAGKSFDLLVLKEVVQKMSGIEMSEEVTMSQLEALCGGELLKAEGGYFGQIRNTKKSSQRLRDAVVDGELALPLCILMAQQRNGVVFFEDNERHLKLVGKLYDQCQDTLVQFGGFLASQMTAEEYEAHLPSLSDLGQKYHLTPEVAFYLSRPMFQHQIQLKFESSKATKTDKPLSQKVIYQHYIDAVNNVMDPIVQSARLLQTTKVWNNISPQLYVTFWSLCMYDVHVPLERYEAEIQRFKAQIIQLEENKEMTASKKKKDKERWVQLIDKLKSEQREQEDHNQNVMAWLKHERDSWFPSKSTKSETITQFLQLCMFPRCVYTASDAIYCAKFVHTLHNLKTPNFSTLLCFDRVFSDISYTVASCTENEASRYGRFLCSMLEIVMRWHGDKKIYEKECGSYPGFVTVLRATNTDKADHLDYENFRHVCHKWQYKLTKALVVCLESKDYTQIRNTIMVLTKILPFYPKVLNLGQALERRIDKICEEEKDKRQDIYTLAMGYSGQLKAKKKDMVAESEFHKKEKPAPPPNPAPTTNENTSATTTTTNVKQEKTENQPSTNSAADTKATAKSESQDSSAAKPKAAVAVKKEAENKKSSSPSVTKNESSSSQEKSSTKSSSSSTKTSGTSTPTPRRNSMESPSRTPVTNSTSASKSSGGSSSSRSQSASGRVSKTPTSSSSAVKVDLTGSSDSESKTSGKSKSKDKEKEKEKKEEKEKETNDRSKEKEKTAKEKSKEKDKERSRSKEKEREKGKEKSKDKDKTPRSKHNTSTDATSKDGDYEKEAKKRKIEGSSSPYVQDKERSRSTSVEREKDKERNKEKGERKRVSTDLLDGKDVKRRREDNDTAVESSKTKSKPEENSHKEKKSSVKLVRKVTSESTNKKEKDREEKEPKVTSKKKEVNDKEKESKDEESKSRRHHRSSSRRT